MFLDRIDKAILKMLQEDCSITNVELAERVALSPPACLKRVQRLLAEQVISERVAIVNPEKLGSCLHMVIEVYMERDRKDLNNAFMKHIQGIPQVKECYQVTGEVDFVLIIEVPNMAAFDTLREEVFYNNDNVRSFKTHISMNRAKYTTQTNVYAWDES
ncbi:AsnC family transcriptional regulator [Vibrio sp. MACH09]|uniref:Lrp/AsnC family transcriptional regulator n=1 Tax=unclassified Vibrio TaxID=2614977 RepID=UPI00149365C6|nr:MULTISPECIES: Lrp/AsnC family transcriptional regulator [unclassified Vibrio]NOI68464.1 Lrp/AsnC family transcriptional regulator [Vibrio sp. 99-8-1]GLO62273.1 AsnC family transcriptional regulator [Vibrio sp. MACH09]